MDNINKPFRIFIHGLESGNQGTKSVFFRNKYPDMLTPNFTGQLQERMEKLQTILSSASNIRLVGSSFGGLMATLFASENQSKVDKMILLAPAINMMDSSATEKKDLLVPTWIYHGRNDEVIPLTDVEKTAKNRFKNLSFHSVDDDHFLHKTFKTIDWDNLLA